MSLENIKLNLVKMIKDKGGVSFVEIENFFDEIGFDYRGEEQLNSSKNNKIIYWSDWNEQACKLITELLKNKQIEMTLTPLWVYIVEGKVLTVPVYEKYKRYEQWLPLEFN